MKFNSNVGRLCALALLLMILTSCNDKSSQAPPANAAIKSLTLIDADTDQPIPEFDPIPNNAKINLAKLPTRKLNIRANTTSDYVGRVVFNEGKTGVVANEPPYSLYGYSTSPLDSQKGYFGQTRDRTFHKTSWVAAPRGKRFQDRVLRLDDGTLIDREPQPNKYGTWSWRSIKNYLDGNHKVRPLSEIIRDVIAHLRGGVWLPYDEEYILLALTVPVTYMQNVFESVPLLFTNGPKGSGKSGLGRAMALVCANSFICGQSSAASIARFIDESRGFVVLDDLEMIASRGGEFSELVQALKLSYTKKTATKLWTDVKTMRTKQLNFYGVKMINNTQGADDILSSRMLRIQTRRLPDYCKEEFLQRAPLDPLALSGLRDELHTWAFESVAKIDEEYRKQFPKLTDRAQEIEAPLKVMALLAGDDELMAGLEVALARQRLTAADPDDPRALLREALKGLVAQGYFQFSPTHLLMEMRSLTHRDLDKSYASEIPEWSRVEWVGRMLRSHDLIDPDPQTHERKRLFGANLRLYHAHRDFVAEVMKEYEDEMREK
jgi:hypothetical protein